jgi:hypothetical protein
MKSVLFILILSTTFSCKARQEASQTKALDNLAGGDVSYDCFGEHPEPTIDVLQSKEESFRSEAVARALTAIPPNIFKAVFQDQKTKVVFSEKDLSSAEICPGAATYSKEALAGCFKPNKKGDAPIIYIKVSSDPKETMVNIQHTLVRSVAAVLSYTILDAPPANGSDSESYADARAELAASFLSDLDTQNKLDEADITKVFPKASVAKGADQTARSKSIIAAKSEEAVDNATHTVFIDAMHSYLCNASQSRVVFKKSFPNTWESFNVAFVPDLGVGSDDTTASAEESKSGAAKEGFSMWGRYGAGNGPLRQGLSNWGAHRASGGGLLNARRFANGGGYIMPHRLGSGGNLNRRRN